MAKTPEEKLAEALEVQVKADKRVAQLKVQVNGKEKKAETQRAIILGKLVMKHHPEMLAGLVARVTRESDQKAFVGFLPVAAKDVSHTPSLNAGVLGSHLRAA